jgi:hypothetical protein
MPAKAGIQSKSAGKARIELDWIPAFAGMTKKHRSKLNEQETSNCRKPSIALEK